MRNPLFEMDERFDRVRREDISSGEREHAKRDRREKRKKEKEEILPLEKEEEKRANRKVSRGGKRGTVRRSRA